MTLHLSGSEGQLKARKCKKPKMTWHRGRTWDTERIIIDGENYDMHFDSTWGRRGYFVHEDTWYSLDLYELQDATKGSYRYDMNIRNLRTNRGEQ